MKINKSKIMMSILLVMLLTLGGAFTVLAASVTPTTWPNGPDPTPTQLGDASLIQYKPWNNVQTGTNNVTHSSGGLQLNIVVSNNKKTLTSWTSQNYLVYYVVVKGGNQGANIYHYPLGSMGDTNLVTPTGQDISHITFYYKQVTPPPPPPPTTGTLTFIKVVENEQGVVIADDTNFTINISGGITDVIVNASMSVWPTRTVNLNQVYIISENTLPAGYTIKSISPASITLTESNLSAIVTITNIKDAIPPPSPTTGTVIVTKTFTDESSPEGITFELKLGEIVLTETTNNDGIATFLDVEPGSYELFETNIPQGYINNLSENNTVVVTAGNITYVTVTNSPEGEEEPPVEEPPVDPPVIISTFTPVPGISLTKSVLPGVVILGMNVLYTFTVTNTGNVPLENVVVTDPMFGEGWSQSIGTLFVGQTVSFNQVMAVALDAEPGLVSNTATVTGSFGGSPVTNSASAVFEVLIVVEEQQVPEGELIVLDDEIPLGPATLPDTGEASAAIFYGMGALISLAGFGLKRRIK